MDIDKLIKEAILNKNEAAKEAFRAIKAELLLNSSSKNPKPCGKDIQLSNGEYVNELLISIIRKQIQIKEEQISMYEANNREDLANIYRKQMEYLKEFLPPKISEDRLEEAIVTAYPNGYTQKEMGRVIKEIKEFFPTADGKLISEIVKKHIV